MNLNTISLPLVGNAKEKPCYMTTWDFFLPGFYLEGTVLIPPTNRRGTLSLLFKIRKYLLLTTTGSDFEAQSLRSWIDWGQYISIKKNFGWWLKQLARVTEESFHLMWALGTSSRKCALHTCCRAVSVLG
jgi:hypothetical protein